MQRRLLRQLVAESIAHSVSSEALVVDDWLVLRVRSEVATALRFGVRIHLLPSAVLEPAFVVINCVAGLLAFK